MYPCVNYIHENVAKLAKVEFLKKPEYSIQKTNDGADCMSIVQLCLESGCASVVCSNECSLKEKRQDCMFCNANATKDHYAESERNDWKYPNHISEVFASAD